MLAAVPSVPSSVNFPSSADTPPVTQHPRPPHLPFRRISLPTPPSTNVRESVVSVTSVDSFPEERPANVGVGPQSSSLAVPAVMRNINAARKAKRLSTSVEASKRRRRDLRPVDEAREAKRRKVVYELYETEKAYVDGLELIYSHFLTPIIASLDTQQPLLDRSALTSVFSNFIDIWNLHRSFFSSLQSLLSTISPTSSPPPLSPILLSHFPYLSLYTPFITSFNTTVTALTNMLSPSSLSYNQLFASFVTAKEADPQCGKLKLRDWLLTIVQRCPRYLLLLKDLINCTDPDDSEHEQLLAVHALVSKITLSLNTSLHTHAQTLALLALQRSTSSLPPTLHFISPGRTLLRRGPLVMLERSGEGRQREFLLFSDCLLWLESENATRVSVDITNNGRNTPANGNGMKRPMVFRTRSKSEAELSALRARFAASASSRASSDSPSDTAAPRASTRAANLTTPTSGFPPPSPPSSAPANVIRQSSSVSPSRNSGEEKWVFKGKAELVDLEVVVACGAGEAQERRFEILSPEGSFALYAETQAEKEAWSSAIRNAKAALLVLLNITHPNSTLTSSASTNHLRRSLQALPFPPHDERIGTIGKSSTHGWGRKGGKGGGKGKGKAVEERRGRVEHWLPAIWIPDAKTEGCMRCGRGFGWRRRRHHCRLCGRCVCAACSGRTFFILDSTAKEPTKSARACDACYETVFPLFDPPSDSEHPDPLSVAATQPPTATTSAPAPSLEVSSPYSNTITSLTGFPSWLSMPSLPLTTAGPSDPEALMKLDRKPKDREKGGMRHVDDGEGEGEGVKEYDVIREGSGAEIGPRGRVRRSAPQRRRSSYEILEDFEGNLGEKGVRGGDLGGSGNDNDHDHDHDNDNDKDNGNGGDVDGELERSGADGDGDGDTRSRVSVSVTLSEGHTVSARRRENTARRHKRFSLPAVALQTTSVVAQTSGVDGGDGSSGSRRGGANAGKVKRFSLVLGGRAHAHGQVQGQGKEGFGGSQSGLGMRKNDAKGEGAKSELGRGVAASKLSELLARRRG